MIKPPSESAGLLSDYMTGPEAAKELRIGYRTLKRWHALRCGPPRTKVGRQFLYRRVAVAAWLVSREQEA